MLSQAPTQSAALPKGYCCSCFLSGPDKLLWLLLRSSVAVLYSLPVEQHIDKVIQESGEE